MSCRGKDDIISIITSYINENYNENEIPKIKFNELSVQKDSMCIAISKDSKPTERVADVTGKWLRGEMELSIIYRVMLNSRGSSDLEYTSIIDDIYKFLKKTFRKLKSEDYFLYSITLVSGAVLDTVYSGGVKDFNNKFKVIYERRQEL
jgi:hypothetical protein